MFFSNVPHQLTTRCEGPTNFLVMPLPARGMCVLAIWSDREIGRGGNGYSSYMARTSRSEGCAGKEDRTPQQSTARTRSARPMANLSCQYCIRYISSPRDNFKISLCSFFLNR